MCSEKVSYATRDEVINVGQRRLSEVSRLYFYQCPECGQFHLTKGRRMPSLRVKMYPIPVPPPAPRRTSGFTLGDLITLKGIKI